MAKRKRTVNQTTINDIISGSFCEFQSLRDEIEEWASNLESNNMEHLPKYEEVNDAKEALENFVDNEPEISEKLEALIGSIKLEIQVPRKSDIKSRAGRLSVAMGEIQQVIDHLELMEKDDDGEIEELQSNLEDAISEAENVSFPGMY